MKKILTLLIAVAAFASVNAQTREENRRVILGGGNDNGTYGGRNDRDVIFGGGNNGDTYSGNRQAEIDRINQEYDNKIYSIRNNPNLSNAEKDRVIRQLEKDRQRRINDIDRRYRKNRDDDRDDRYDRDERYERKNNGKKKGWELGRGNPHRDGSNDKAWKKNYKKEKKHKH